MPTPTDPAPSAAVNRTAPVARRTSSFLRGLLLLILMAAVSTGVSYGVQRYLHNQEQQSSLAALDSLRKEIESQQADLAQKLAVVQSAAQSTGLLVQDQSLAQRLTELEKLKSQVALLQQQNEQQLAAMQQRLEATLGQQSQATSAALSARLSYSLQLSRAQSQALDAKLELGEGNRGLAVNQLRLVELALSDAATAAPGDAQKQRVAALQSRLQAARSALITQAPEGRDLLSALVKELGDALAASGEGGAVPAASAATPGGAPATSPAPTTNSAPSTGQ